VKWKFNRVHRKPLISYGSMSVRSTDRASSLRPAMTDVCFNNSEHVRYVKRPSNHLLSHLLYGRRQHQTEIDEEKNKSSES